MTTLVTNPSAAAAAPMSSQDMIRLTLAQIHAERLSGAYKLAEYARANALQLNAQFTAGMMNQMVPGLNLSAIPFGSTVNYVNTSVPGDTTTANNAAPAAAAPAATPAPAAPVQAASAAPAASPGIGTLGAVLLGVAGALGTGGVGALGYGLSSWLNKPAAAATAPAAAAPTTFPVDINWSVNPNASTSQQQTTVTQPSP